MILECKSCQKKFLVPDNAIPASGRLVQCSSCGNKWTQFPLKTKISKSPKVVQIEKTEKKIFKQPQKKKKTKKKVGPSIYSREYLEKKHGINLDAKNLNTKEKKEIKSKTSSFGFYSYFVILVISIISVFGILNLTKEMIIFNFPFLEIYIDYLYENLNNFRVLFQSLIF